MSAIVCQPLLVTSHALTHLISQQSFEVATTIPILTDKLHNLPKVTQLINRRTRLRTLKVPLKHLYTLLFGHKRKVVSQLLAFKMPYHFSVCLQSMLIWRREFTYWSMGFSMIYLIIQRASGLVFDFTLLTV